MILSAINHRSRRRRLREAASDDRMRVLVAIPSTNQMYSGVGRALMELSRRMGDRVAYTFAIDDLNTRNVELLQNFASKAKLTVHVGRHGFDPRCVEPVNLDLRGVLMTGEWDVVELIGFANAATGRTVLESIGQTALAYTPHDQPLWTVPMNESQHINVSQIHRAVIKRADVAFADSPHERAELQRLVPDRSHVEYHPLGCDFGAFEAGAADRRLQLLFVGDLNEIRKRFDRVREVMALLLLEFPDLKLVVAGNKSAELTGEIPDAMRNAIVPRGYVDESEIRRLYRESRGLLLLSDVEAFGLPILEAMACGTPVYLNNLATTKSLFGDFKAAVFVQADDISGTAKQIAEGLARGTGLIELALAERLKLRERFDWELLARQKAKALAAAWWRRNRWSWVA
jgi:glycosyltransferase involved in cell wall biosynthesis